jgi:hypothetical protein
MATPVRAPAAPPVTRAARQAKKKALPGASTPPCACSTQAAARPERLAAKVTDRLIPPVSSGSSIASVNSPSSGSWKATEPKVASERKLSAARPKISMTAMKARRGPPISAPKVALNF